MLINSMLWYRSISSDWKWCFSVPGHSRIHLKLYHIDINLNPWSSYQLEISWNYNKFTIHISVPELPVPVRENLYPCLPLPHARYLSKQQQKGGNGHWADGRTFEIIILSSLTVTLWNIFPQLASPAYFSVLERRKYPGAFWVGKQPEKITIGLMPVLSRSHHKLYGLAIEFPVVPIEVWYHLQGLPTSTNMPLLTGTVPCSHESSAGCMATLMLDNPMTWWHNYWLRSYIWCRNTEGMLFGVPIDLLRALSSGSRAWGLKTGGCPPKQGTWHAFHSNFLISCLEKGLWIKPDWNCSMLWYSKTKDYKTRNGFRTLFGGCSF